MRRRTVSMVLGLAVVVVAAVGLLDAVVGRAWDLVAVFGLVLLLSAGLVALGLGPRRHVTLRRDLAAVLADRALRTGEDEDAVLDRAVATYLEALSESGDDPDRSDAVRGGA